MTTSHHTQPECNRHTRRIARRNRILLRDGYACRNCGSGRELTLDHIVPQSQGGTNDDANLQILCSPCNAAKGSQPWIVLVVPLANPNTPEDA